MKIISGLQTGADQFGLDFAKLHNIPHLANTYKDFISSKGETLDYLKMRYNVAIVTDKIGVPGLKKRTLYNVKNSDITLIFIDDYIENTRDSNLTFNLCKKFNKDYRIIPIYGEIFVDYIPKIGTINITGQRKFRTQNAKLIIFKVLEELCPTNQAKLNW